MPKRHKVTRMKDDCQGLSNELEIYGVIFEKYEKNIRPVKDANTPIMAIISAQWMTLLGVDVAMEAVHISMDYKQTWKDESLVWNPADFDGIETISVPEDLVWLPDVCMVS
uniref:Neurotransmitter-gated ion-channel ligand-binding domain-containing protein n=1 Tax=Plectus sambesii TaxID=2011161 RepID=A0A914X2C2_9BILA